MYIYTHCSSYYEKHSVSIVCKPVGESKDIEQQSNGACYTLFNYCPS